MSTFIIIGEIVGDELLQKLKCTCGMKIDPQIAFLDMPIGTINWLISLDRGYLCMSIVSSGMQEPGTPGPLLPSSGRKCTVIEAISSKIVYCNLCGINCGPNNYECKEKPNITMNQVRQLWFCLLPGSCCLTRYADAGQIRYE